MRRIMKKVEFSTSSPVLMPPPLFVTVLRRTINDRYWDSHGVRPATQRIALAPLFHPDYAYDRSLHCQTNNVTQLVEGLYEDPKYVLERVAQCAKAFRGRGIPEMTTKVLLDLLVDVNAEIVNLLSTPKSAHNRYFREINNRLEFVRITKELSKSRFGIIKNEANRPPREAWRPLTPESLESLRQIVDIPTQVLAKPFRYVLLKPDSTYSIRPIYESIEWSALLPFIDNQN